MIDYNQIDQIRENSTNAVAVYAPTSTTRQSQIFLKVANVSAESAKVRIFHDADGTTYDETTAIIWDLEINPGEFLEVDHIFMTDTSARLAYRSSVANALTITVYGIIDRI